MSDADLHGLVDGHIDPHRRADMLRRAAASPHDRALIEAWQDQNDMIRAAFAGVENEPLPRALDLRTPPKLYTVPRTASPAVKAPRNRRSRSIAAAATLAVAAVGLAGSWYIAGLPADDHRAPLVRPSTQERVLADRTVSALAFGETDAFLPAGVAEPPPTTTIPDLSAEGFTFTGAEARNVSPKTVIFRYRDANDERVAIGATRTAGDDSSPVPRETGFIWRSGRVAYAIFGTSAPSRLHAIAMSLRAEAMRE